MPCLTAPACPVKAAAFDRGDHVKFAFYASDLHRLPQDQPQNWTREVSVLILAVHSHFAGSWFDPNPRNRVFSFPGGVAADPFRREQAPVAPCDFDHCWGCLRRPLPESSR